MKITFKISLIYGIVLTGLCSLSLYSCNSNNENTAGQSATPNQAQLVEQGKYLVEAIGCNDCHTPMTKTANGFVYDSSRFLAGANQSDTVISLTPQEIKRIQSGAQIDLPYVAFIGGWGVSFPANLTPDSTTGIGGWTPDIFIRAIRSGKYMGVVTGRPLMPPMPWSAYSKFTDNDLKSIFAFLQTIPAVHNRVPSYVPFNQIKVRK